MNGAPTLLRVSHRYGASAERVFDAWLDPQMAARFLYATDQGRMQRVEIDARVGGGYVIVETREDGDAAHYGRYLEIERPHRLVFTLSLDPAQPGDRITIEIRRAGDGCELQLTHELAPQYAQYADRSEAGWRHILATLAQRLAQPPH